MPNNNNYTTAVNNFESLINFVEDEHPALPDNLFDELRACVFTLKIQPQYQGLKDADEVASKD